MTTTSMIDFDVVGDNQHAEADYTLAVLDMTGGDPEETRVGRTASNPTAFC